jgi:hypothetical protein
LEKVLWSIDATLMIQHAIPSDNVLHQFYAELVQQMTAKNSTPTAFMSWSQALPLIFYQLFRNHFRSAAPHTTLALAAETTIQHLRLKRCPNALALMRYLTLLLT